MRSNIRAFSSGMGGLSTQFYHIDANSGAHASQTTLGEYPTFIRR